MNSEHVQPAAPPTKLPLWKNICLAYSETFANLLMMPISIGFMSRAYQHFLSQSRMR